MISSSDSFGFSTSLCIPRKACIGAIHCSMLLGMAGGVVEWRAGLEADEVASGIGAAGWCPKNLGMLESV
jgi:hypothetical protein